MKLSIVLMLLVAGCGKHQAKDIDLKPGESASLEFRIPVVGDCSADGGKTWFSARKDGTCYMADSDKAMSGEVALQLQTLKEENAKLKAELKARPKLPICAVPSTPYDSLEEFQKHITADCLVMVPSLNLTITEDAKRP